MNDELPVRRRVDRVHGVLPLGPDEQVDDKALVIPPTDPSLVDPFIALSEDWFSRPGFNWHPHRGIETVTIVLDGALEHGDNRGCAGVLAPGDVQWMTAGSGIVHRELAFRDEHAHTLQLWVNLPAALKMTDARYQDLGADRLATVTGPGTLVRAISGSAGDPAGDTAGDSAGGAVGPAENHWPITGLMLTLEPTSSLTQPLPGPERAFLYVLSGRVRVGRDGTVLGRNQVAWSDPVGPDRSVLDLHAPDGDEVVRAVLFAGRPIGEPVVLGGSFVMNTAEQIAEAYRDFHAGRFGPVPNLARR
ncbi:MAG TPA: pirin family protein [Mycobacteriales bacterium]|nr:pirin family protein [Mycobacteriales bacterium]